MQTKTTYWIDPEDNPLIIDDGDSVLIEVKVIDQVHGQALDVFLAPALFGALRRAMRKAEQGTKATPQRTRDEKPPARAGLDTARAGPWMRKETKTE